MPLPPVDRLAFGVDDDRPHEGGGHCVAFPSDDKVGHRRDIIDQYVVALDKLIDDAGEDGSWLTSRPILFIAHHICELALNMALARVGSSSDPGSNHSLSARLAPAIRDGALAGRTQEEREWCERFIAALEPLCGDGGFAGRFADRGYKGAPLEDRWCCIVPPAIRAGVIVFAEICLVEESKFEDQEGPSQ